jgi:hypothetical protein
MKLYEYYRSSASYRGSRSISRVYELDAMAIVARWLSERDAADGRLVYLRGPVLEPAALWPPAVKAAAAEIAQS